MDTLPVLMHPTSSIPSATRAAGRPATRPTGRRRALVRGLGGASAAALLALSGATLTAAPALAHDQLLSTTPEAGSTVTTTPDDVALTFSGDLITGQGIQNVVTVTDEDGHQWQDGAATVSGPGLSATLCAGMPNGDYEVAYRVVYSDGHSEAKRFGFTLDDPAAPDAGAPQDCGVPNPDAAVSSGEEPTSAAAGSASGSAGSAATANPGTGAGTDGNAGTASSVAEPAATAPTADATDPAAGPDAGATVDSAETSTGGLPAWVWVVGGLGVLLVAAAMLLVFRRAKAIGEPAGGRPGSES